MLYRKQSQPFVDSIPAEQTIDEPVRVRAATRIPLAVGERMYLRLQARPCFERAVLD